MRIIQTKGIVKNGQINLTVPSEFQEGEVDLIIIAENEPDEFERRHQMMIAKVYDTPEKIIDLIHQVKLEMLEEKGRA